MTTSEANKKRIIAEGILNDRLGSVSPYRYSLMDLEHIDKLGLTLKDLGFVDGNKTECETYRKYLDEISKKITGSNFSMDSRTLHPDLSFGTMKRPISSYRLTTLFILNSIGVDISMLIRYSKGGKCFSAKLDKTTTVSIDTSKNTTTKNYSATDIIGNIRLFLQTNNILPKCNLSMITFEQLYHIEHDMHMGWEDMGFEFFDIWKDANKPYATFLDDVFSFNSMKNSRLRNELLSIKIGTYNIEILKALNELGVDMEILAQYYMIEENLTEENLMEDTIDYQDDHNDYVYLDISKYFEGAVYYTDITYIMDGIPTTKGRPVVILSTAWDKAFIVPLTSQGKRLGALTNIKISPSLTSYLMIQEMRWVQTSQLRGFKGILAPDVIKAIQTDISDVILGNIKFSETEQKYIRV